MTRDEIEPLPAWLAWPVRVLAVIFVVPFKLAWDLFAVVMRCIGRYVLAPVWRYVLYPVLYYGLWVPIRWITVNILWRPLVWVAEHILAPLFTALWNGLVWFVRALGPFWRLLGRVLLEMAKAVGWALDLVYRYLLRPLGLALKWATIACYRYLMRPIGYVLAFIGIYVVVPVAKAVAWAWNHSVVLLWRYLVVIPVSWAWRTLVVPPARWVRSAVLHPIAETTRRVLATLGLR
ncbi:hypothetical protein [Dactylosporangium sp. NPDC048998]|uniref:hypothetical protein n=1 Tax=Dactylosporangium sp. NPDC048998 TaxID=3363976 RepID=UPI00371A4B00